MENTAILERKQECPSCLTGKLVPFYTQKRVPAHSCILLTDQSDARNFPEGELELGFCPECGFISNMAFNNELIDYTTDYEDQQGFSKTFVRFAEKLTDRLIKRYALKNKRIVEIGCGKGDFLKLICDLGDNYGFGIDPAYIENRLQDRKLRFFQEHYSEKHTHLKADMIICRHTLEHIESPNDFLTLLLKSLKSNPQASVFIEIPDSRRILSEGAFWDIYHEHCSYFTRESLAMLFTDRGFRILDINLDYNDQYIMMESKLNSSSNREYWIREDVGMFELIEQSKQRLGENIARWNEIIHKIAATESNLAIWGSGSKCVTFLSQCLDPDLNFKVVDINPFRHGKFLPGSAEKIENPNILRAFKPDVVLVMNSIYTPEIEKELMKMALSPQILELDEPGRFEFG